VHIGRIVVDRQIIDHVSTDPRAAYPGNRASAASGMLQTCWFLLNRYPESEGPR
jgi:hypothetical protein